eukprot:319213_1
MLGSMILRNFQAAAGRRILPPSVSGSLFSMQQRSKSKMSCRSKKADLIIPGTIKLKPLTPGTRHARIADRSHLWTGDPVKELATTLRKTGGRCRITGKITVRGRGGGPARIYRVMDFKRDMYNQVGTVERLEFDPCRSAHVALVKYPGEVLKYMVAPDGLNPGDVVMSSRTEELNLAAGNSMPLVNMPIGTIVHNVEFWPFRGAGIARSAGTFAKIMEKGGRKKGYVTLEMPCKELRLVHETCMATVGRCSNINYHHICLGKAGARRNLGRRPKVRGVAMNACDHPHGGGEGKSKGHNSVSKWGMPTKGYRTRKKTKIHSWMRVERRPPNPKRYKKSVMKNSTKLKD